MAISNHCGNLAGKKPSIMDVAHALKVSKTTVSFVVNGRAEEKRISNSLSERILKFVAEVGYKANPLAKSLRTNKTNIISLIMDDISNPFFAKFARAIEQQAFGYGLCVVYVSVKTLEKKRALESVHRDNYAEGSIIAPSQNVNREVISSLINDGYPFVLFDHYINGIDSHYVGIDNKNSAFNAVIHLIDEGFDEIAFISNDSAKTQIQDRIEGYSLALKSKKLKSHIKKIARGKEINQVKTILKDFFVNNPNLKSVIFSSGQLCKIGLKVLNELGKAVAKDIAVVSFDDCEFFELCDPPVTAVAQPVEMIAENILHLLMTEIKHSEKEIPRKITLAASLNIRASSLRGTYNKE